MTTVNYLSTMLLQSESGRYTCQSKAQFLLDDKFQELSSAGDMSYVGVSAELLIDQPLRDILDDRTLNPERMKTPISRRKCVVKVTAPEAFHQYLKDNGEKETR